ncbi:MAG: ATP-binding protein [Melioribacteraceae bacterium]|nr:ATP-binding protein [Melioribacteraceae bacterium]MCF8265681.1 ATP-binding protein [Melioribacteraceae bacterium]MCF8411839.1 ATP-binding protein [Melioribacteraceae bacterium]MCF8431806.1 ATP-binding protein [Melioribacteraceae bacterium]
MNKELVIKSTTDNLARVRDFITSTAKDVGFNNETVGEMVLAVDEACTNVIKHAYKYSPDRTITVNIEFVDGKFRISITDNGIHFNPSTVPDPDIKVYHKEKRTGGLGMFLMKKLMDEVSYNTLNEDRNQVILVKYLN